MLKLCHFGRCGGNWLGTARSWVQWNISNGDSKTWGSDETITMTMAEMEEFAREVAYTQYVETYKEFNKNA